MARHRRRRRSSGLCPACRRHRAAAPRPEGRGRRRAAMYGHLKAGLTLLRHLHHVCRPHGGQLIQPHGVHHQRLLHAQPLQGKGGPRGAPSARRKQRAWRVQACGPTVPGRGPGTGCRGGGAGLARAPLSAAHACQARCQPRRMPRRFVRLAGVAAPTRLPGLQSASRLGLLLHTRYSPRVRPRHRWCPATTAGAMTTPASQSASQTRACLQRVGHQVADGSGVDAHQPVLRVRRVEHGPQQVEGGAHAQRLAHRHHSLRGGSGATEAAGAASAGACGLRGQRRCHLCLSVARSSTKGAKRGRRKGRCPLCSCRCPSGRADSGQQCARSASDGSKPAKHCRTERQHSWLMMRTPPPYPHPAPTHPPTPPTHHHHHHHHPPTRTLPQALLPPCRLPSLQGGRWAQT